METFAIRSEILRGCYKIMPRIQNATEHYTAVSRHEQSPRLGRTYPTKEYRVGKRNQNQGGVLCPVAGDEISSNRRDTGRGWQRQQDRSALVKASATGSFLPGPGVTLPLQMV